MAFASWNEIINRDKGGQLDEKEQLSHLYPVPTCIQQQAMAQGARGERQGKGKRRESPSPIAGFLKYVTVAMQC